MRSSVLLVASTVFALTLAGCATTGGVDPAPPAPERPPPPPPVTEEVSPALAAPAPVPTEPSEDRTAEPPIPEPAPASAPAPAPPPESPFIFDVRTVEKEPGDPMYGVGHRLGFAINGEAGRPIVMVRGETYTFRVDAGIQHDFYLSTSEVGWGAATYSKGVTGQFVYEGVVRFTPPADAPDLLYYQCRNHRNMGGPIFVVDKGEEDTPLAELAAARGVAAAGEAVAPAAGGSTAPAGGASDRQLQQKLLFADMFIHQSAAARRVLESDNAAARDLHRVAEERLDAARAAGEAGNEAEALALVEEATRIMSEAALEVPVVDGAAERTRFEQLYESVQAFQASYERSAEQVARARGSKGESKPVDLGRIENIMSSARNLADDGKYNEAISMLGGAQDALTTALTEMLANQTIIHELVFDTPKDEYEYELSRYLGYEALVPLAIRQKAPSEQTVNLMMGFVDRAREVKALSEPEAARGNYEEAILMLQGATSNIERALQTMGVR